MRFHDFKKNLLNLLNIKIRLQTVMIWYLISLMIETRKHSLGSASELSGLGKPAFSKFLKNNTDAAAYALSDLSRKQAKKYSNILKIMKKSGWAVYILIDDTILNRSSLKSDNVQKFNHGKGYVIGHKWTNIILFFKGIIIPLPPIPYLTKKYCKNNKIKFKSSHDKLVDYLNNLNLYKYLGYHDPHGAAVLVDSGFDDKKIQNAILNKKWHFISALKNTRGLKSKAEYKKTGNAPGWDGCAEFFRKNRIIAWTTVRISTDSSKKKRKDFRVRHTEVFLKGTGKIIAVCSEFKKKRGGRRKFIACSDLKASPRQILTAYGIRWKIEIFHKHVKMHLGFEDIAAKHFSSVKSHVYLVYCAYILLQTGLPGISGTDGFIPEKQQKIKQILNNREIANIIHELTKIGGVERLKSQLKSALAA